MLWLLLLLGASALDCSGMKILTERCDAAGNCTKVPIPMQYCEIAYYYPENSSHDLFLSSEIWDYFETNVEEETAQRLAEQWISGFLSSAFLNAELQDWYLRELTNQQRMYRSFDIMLYSGG